MFPLLKMALLNLGRNLRRTLITVTAISGGLSLMVFNDALSNGMYGELIGIGVSTMAGHVVVQAEGYQRDPEMQSLVTDAGRVDDVLQDSFPGERVVARMLVQGLLQSPRNAVGVVVNGVMPDREPQVSDWAEKVVLGDWLSGDDREILVGEGLAAALEVEPGDKIVLMAQGKEEVTSRMFRVRGLLRTGSADIDGSLAIAPLAALAGLLEAPGAAHQVSVHLADPRDTAAATARARAALADRPDLEVLSWQEALPDLTNFVIQDRNSARVFMLVIGLIVAMGVLNTVLMSVMERVRELGVMLALGVKPARVAGLILLEGAILGLLAAVLGVGLGLLMVWPAAVHGIDFSALMGQTVEVSGVSMASRVFPKADPWALFVFALFAWIFTILSAIWPAVHAARLCPVDAMRHI